MGSWYNKHKRKEALKKMTEFTNSYIEFATYMKYFSMNVSEEMYEIGLHIKKILDIVDEVTGNASGGNDVLIAFLNDWFPEITKENHE